MNKNLNSDSLFHSFQDATDNIKLPKRFTFPFYYEPHLLTRMAVKQLQEHLSTQKEWFHDFGFDGGENGLGKMFGVLVVENEAKEIGFLCGFSGKMADSNHLSGFVPPVFDMLTDGSFFLEGVKELEVMTERVKILENDPDYLLAKNKLSNSRKQSLEEVQAKKIIFKSKKKIRREKRASQKNKLPEKDYNELLAQLEHESKRDHYLLKDLKKHWIKTVAEAEEEFNKISTEVVELKKTRKDKSNDLQQRLFDNYHFLNQAGEVKSLQDIFSHTSWNVPPSGAGECAAPKLLHYAFKHGYRPVTMGEFWWGMSPLSEIRKHQQYYPSCRGKCEPILNHMLKGIPLEDNPVLMYTSKNKTIEFIFEDDDIAIINKPPDLLSIPGKVVQDSVWTRMKHRYPDATGPLVVHRLDMSTSGLMVVAKNKEAHKAIQQQFIQRKVKKTYIALLEGIIEENEGIINLPLRVDLEDRPRQLVCHEHGKSAQTKWKVAERKNGKTLIHFFPITGRTHQLRVHAAHPLGLNMPIFGDDLYGNKTDRLYLHAAVLEITHPTSGEQMIFKLNPKFATE